MSVATDYSNPCPSRVNPDFDLGSGIPWRKMRHVQGEKKSLITAIADYSGSGLPYPQSWLLEGATNQTMSLSMIGSGVTSWLNHQEEFGSGQDTLSSVPTTCQTPSDPGPSRIQARTALLSRSPMTQDSLTPRTQSPVDETRSSQTTSPLSSQGASPKSTSTLKPLAFGFVHSSSQAPMPTARSYSERESPMPTARARGKVYLHTPRRLIDALRIIDTPQMAAERLQGLMIDQERSNDEDQDEDANALGGLGRRCSGIDPLEAWLTWLWA